MRSIYFLFFLLAAFHTTGANSFHVSIHGTAFGDGSAERPWDLQTALSHPSGVKGGDTIWIHGGTYWGLYVSKLTGEPSAPIIVKAYDKEKVILDGNINRDARGVLIIKGNYTWYWGITVTNSNRNHMYEEPFIYKEGVSMMSANNKLINCIVHNNIGSGIGFWKEAVDSEIYGCIIYNNGYRRPDRGHGHGIYAQNVTGLKVIRDNILFNSYGLGLHIYSEKDINQGYLIEGNTFFNSGMPGADRLERHIILGGTMPSGNAVIRNNYFYHRPGYPIKGDAAIQFGYASNNTDAEFSNNYLVDGSFYFIKQWDAITFTHNTMINRSKNMKLFVFNEFHQTQAPLFNWNHYHVGSLNNLPFEEWKIFSKQDRNSVFYQSPPSAPQYFIRKNNYEPHRFHLTVFNWGNQKQLAIDGSELMQVGDSYEVLDVSNLSGGPIQSNAYLGGNIWLSMDLKEIEMPHAELPNLDQFKHTAPDFGVFIIKVIPQTITSTKPIDIHGESLTVYPNPASDRVYLSFSSLKDDLCEISIADMTGKTVYFEMQEIKAGKNNLSISISHLLKDTYVVNIQSGKLRLSSKFFKK